MPEPSSVRSFIEGLVCDACNATYSHRESVLLCPRCDSVLDPFYRLDSLRASVSLDSILSRRPGVWRWREFLPVTDERCHIDIGAGASHLIVCPKLSRWIGACVYVKYEGQQPTGSLKDHSFAVAVSKAELYPTLAFGYLSPSIGLVFPAGSAGDYLFDLGFSPYQP